MAIVHIPLVKQAGNEGLDTSLPSAIADRIPAERWREVVSRLNEMLHKRNRIISSRVLSALFLLAPLRTHLESLVDREIGRYLESKNLLLKRHGIRIYHPKDRVYSGLDVHIDDFLGPASG